jgi:glutamate 5-kinase
VQRLVIKIGSSVLTDARGQLLRDQVERLARDIARGLAARCQPVVVSSGAIACGMARLGLARRPKRLAQLQACAAVGQGELMHLYTLAFARHGVLTGQVLLTQDDLADRRRFRNAKQTLLSLLRRRVVPVINENDTVAVEEITFGDNDRLAALVAVAVEARLLVILSDVDGLLQDGKPVQRVERVRQAAALVKPRPARQTTTGGMRSKLEAARIVGHCGIPMVIANGKTPGVLGEVLDGRPVGTVFIPAKNPLTSRKWWIARTTTPSSGAKTGSSQAW